jgi:hypothetical protein
MPRASQSKPKPNPANRKPAAASDATGHGPENSEINSQSLTANPQQETVSAVATPALKGNNASEYLLLGLIESNGVLKQY